MRQELRVVSQELRFVNALTYLTGVAGPLRERLLPHFKNTLFIYVMRFSLPGPVRTRRHAHISYFGSSPIYESRQQQRCL